MHRNMPSLMPTFSSILKSTSWATLSWYRLTRYIPIYVYVGLDAFIREFTYCIILHRFHLFLFSLQISWRISQCWTRPCRREAESIRGRNGATHRNLMPRSFYIYISSTPISPLESCIGLREGRQKKLQVAQRTQGIDSLTWVISPA